MVVEKQATDAETLQITQRQMTLRTKQKQTAANAGSFVQARSRVGSSLRLPCRCRVQEGAKILPADAETGSTSLLHTPGQLANKTLLGS
jgi:allophanate hydrolase subunit 2